MATEQSALLTDFARTCKAAARAVSLYPGVLPAIGTSLSRLVAAAGRLTSPLLLLARAPDDLTASGGIGPAWTSTGRTHFEIREIDCAEVLRERGGGEADWDRIH
jgi:hypothetical protein